MAVGVVNGQNPAARMGNCDDASRSCHKGSKVVAEEHIRVYSTTLGVEDVGRWVFIGRKLVARMQGCDDVMIPADRATRE